MDADIDSSPNTNRDAATPWRAWRLGEYPEMMEEAYRESMRESARTDSNAIRLYDTGTLS